MTRKSPSALGRRIRELREDRGISANALSIKAGLARAHLNSLENGQIQSLNIDTLEKVAAALGVAPADLLTPPSPSKGAA
jgi:putative transcriptional regulator